MQYLFHTYLHIQRRAKVGRRKNAPLPGLAAGADTAGAGLGLT